MEVAISMPAVQLIAGGSGESPVARHSRSKMRLGHLLKDFPAVEANEFQDHVRCM